MGWPENTDLLKTFYPTSVLVTGFDILFFWVARMMMMGIYFMDDIPFEDVYVHALVRDEDGKKMSKSKGNVIDPLTVIEKYGTDAFRFTLAAFAAMGRDIKMSEKRVEGYRHFINKLWNAARFALMHIDRGYEKIDTDRLTLPDKWILSRLSHVITTVSNTLEEYRFNDAAGTLYNFVWHEFCDWYLEIIKPSLYGDAGEEVKETTKGVLWMVMRDVLILLHPFIPFVTEEIWNQMPGTGGSIMKAVFPADAPDAQLKIENRDAEKEMTPIMEVITGIRNIRGEMNIAPSMKLDAVMQTQAKAEQNTLQAHGDIIGNLARLGTFTVEDPGEKPKLSATAIVGQGTLFVPLEGIIDLSKEAQRLEKEIDKISAELSGISKKLNNPDFLKKAPAEVVDKVRQKNDSLDEKRKKIESHLDRIKGIA
jgi:valyl-tRNA synthetase